MPVLPLARLPERANADPEFRLAARDWNARFALRCGDAAHALRVVDGQLDGQIADAREDVEGADFAVAAPEADWRAFLAPVPRPFYQDLWAAWTHHGFELSGDVASMYAYYPALRRLMDLLREEAH